MDITAFSDFHLVAIHQGFGQAARVSDRPKSSISKNVRMLESRFGTRLLERNVHGVRLTEEGRKFHALARWIIVSVDGFYDQINATKGLATGKLRVAAPSSFSHIWIGRISAEFLLQFPQVELEMVIADQLADVKDDFFDVIIQVNPSKTLDYIGRVVGKDSSRIVVSKSFAEGLGARLKRESDIELPAIGPLHESHSKAWAINVDGRSFRVRPRVQARLPTRVMIRDAVLHGFGFAELPSLMLQDHIACGDLIDLGPAPLPEVEIWALYPTRRLLSPKVSEYVRFLAHYFRSTYIAP
jgi:DNA-binding transcriptional LysR family regulator